MQSMHRLSKLTDAQLLSSTRRAAAKDRRATVELLAHIGEVDARGVYRREACSSMFSYCVQRLHLSEAATAKRIQVARAARRFDGLLAYIADGRVHLTGLSMLVPHLTEDNWRPVLDRAVHKSKREIEGVVAALAPKPDVPPLVRKLPEARTIVRRSETSQLAVSPGSGGGPASGDAPTAWPTLHYPRAGMQALSPGRYKVQFTADQALREKIDQAQDLMRHRVPDGDLAKVFDRALTVLIEKLCAERHGLTSKPRTRKAPPKPGSRYIPAAVKRAVYIRDGGQCTFVDGCGRRCTERGMLEYDHITPFALGGKATVDNIRLRCRAHNQLYAEKVFGREWLIKKRQC